MIKELLKEGLSELGLIPAEEQINAFIIYLSELKRWNKAYNLTGIKKDEDIVIKHFLDSLLYLKAMPTGELRVADVGSGAGFPGIPIKIILPDIEMYLIEPTGKKSIFLRYIIRQLDFKKTEVLEKRIEEVNVHQELALPVDIAVTRALFDIKDFIKKASHIVKKGGTIILNKGPKVKEELNILRDVKHEILTIKLPLSDINRHIVIVRI
ncbi:MAG: 16S rRNA (guanine(527)-N(7))-methyltransferase RsmG [Nitrospira sp.]|nr:16S rRNA (guanine(527)-N(7))-methyltransferase RsmG [Nitrospira sp.]